MIYVRKKRLVLVLLLKKYGSVEFTLRCHYRNEIVSCNKNQFESNILFTNVQKKIFIKHINKFLAFNLHPIIQIVENLTKKITKRLIKEQWMECF